MSRQQMITTPKVQVFVGEPIAHDSERRFLARLRADLTRRGCSARIYANFVTRSLQRQVDLLISTEHRLVHVELKTVDPGLPLIGGINGPWSQLLPGGKPRSLERNFYRQAHDTTYAISDDLHELARRGEVPRISGKYYAHIHTVVCVNPDIPLGSRLDSYKHVDATGYLQLLEQLTTAGVNPPWTNDHWDAFARHLGLVPEEPNSPDEVARRVTIAALDDYRRRFAAAHASDLHEYVPVPARTADRLVPDPVQVLTEAMALERVATFTGPSGSGKSHTALHAALTVAGSGGLPVWVRCGEYQRGRFSYALSRAVAPFTTASCLPFLQQAADSGCPAVVILDGLNECAPGDQAELLEQLGALRLRMPVAAVVTSNLPVGLADVDVNLVAVVPDDDTRAALLSSYGRTNRLAVAQAFVTPMELALAAECDEQLRPDASAPELLDAYISHVCPRETTRAGLRRVAVEMDRKLRGSLTVPEIRALLYRDAGVSSLDAGIDAVFSSPLLTLTQGRASFKHELFGRFLTAEQLVLDAGDPDALADLLNDSRHADLRVHAVALEHDWTRRRDLLLALADPSLLSAAVHGALGSETSSAVRTVIVATLATAMAATRDAQLIREADAPGPLFDIHWNVNAKRTASQQALLHVAGTCLADGLFLDETCRLLDVTDHRCAEEIRQLRDGGHRAAISAVVQATYTGFHYTDERELRKLPASVVVNACEQSRFMRQPLALMRSPAIAMWDGPTLSPPRWGRLTAALQLLDSDDSRGLELLPDMFARAWKTNGYHLRLAALTRAGELARFVDDATRDRMKAALDECDTDNIMLNGSLFETLAAYGGIDPLNSEESIRADIEAVLARPDDPGAWAAAQQIVGMLFEDQNLHGPYDEVLSALDGSDYFRLHVMAARSEAFSFNRDWLLKAIVDRLEYVDDDARAVLRDAVLSMEWDSTFRQEAVAAHLSAVRGWAEIADELPPALNIGKNLGSRAWRIVDELLYSLLRNADPTSQELSALWAELLDLCAPATVDVFGHLKSARTWEYNSAEPTMYERLLAAWPNEVRLLIEWAVLNRARLVATFNHGPAHDCVRLLAEDLAVVGTEDTATLLQNYVDDAEIGKAAVMAIRAIKRRATGP